MKVTPIREITPEEKTILRNGLRSSSAFTLRRSQIVLMRVEEQLTPKQIGERLRCSDQGVREAIHAFNHDGLSCLQPKSRARHDQQSAFTVAGRERLKGLIQEMPRQFGYENSLWTLALLAEQAYQEGLTAWLVDADTVGRALHQAGVRWQRAKQWINSPDPAYAAKKNAETG